MTVLALRLGVRTTTVRAAIAALADAGYLARCASGIVVTAGRLRRALLTTWGTDPIALRRERDDHGRMDQWSAP